MNAAPAAHLLSTACFRSRLLEISAPAATQRLNAMDEAALGDYLTKVLTPPTDFTLDDGVAMLDSYFAAAWAHTFGLQGLPQNLKVLEVASGDTVVVPMGLDLFAGEEGQYVTANLNKGLTEGFRRNAAALRPQITVVEDDAANLERLFPAGHFDLVAYQHAINDVIQNLLCLREGHDTIAANWWDLLPTMTEIINRHWKAGTLEEASREGFLAVIAANLRLLRPGGFLAFNNTVYQYDLNLGYPEDLYHAFVPLARRWIAEAGFGLREVTPADYDPQYWMVLQKF